MCADLWCDSWECSGIFKGVFDGTHKEKKHMLGKMCDIGVWALTIEKLQQLKNKNSKFPLHETKDEMLPQASYFVYDAKLKSSFWYFHKSLLCPLLSFKYLVLNPWVKNHCYSEQFI